MIRSIVERQPIVFGQPPEWYTKFEEIREKRRLDKQMPPYNKIVDSILNDKEESISSDSKDDIVIIIGFELHVGDAKTT